ncbi:MAG: MarR family winged helix-turn-helix transcriptional regulator [Tagaea sp.]|nr:MarR family winged helix-turn-helix transcriptional regulator [Tagaea sp.]
MKLIASPRQAPAPEGEFALEAFLPYRLSVLSNTVSDAIARLYRDRFGLSIAEWRCMAVLGRFAPLAARDVATRTAMDKVQVSRAIASLRARGLALQATDTKDRRRSKLALSAAGRRMHDEIVPLARDAEARLLRDLAPEDRARLGALLARLQRAAMGL